MTAKDHVQLLLLGVALAAPATALGGAHGELLEPEEAFRVSARPLDERTIAVEFRIADGYYLYRDRISFATASGEPISGARIPRGTIKEDQFFGRTEVFREMVSIWVPMPSGSAKAGPTGLKVTSQGCWDGGVCYTPLEQFVSVQPAGASGDNAAAGALGLIAAPDLPDALRMLAWALLLFATGALLLRATHPLPDRPHAALWLAKAGGVIALAWAVAVLIGAASGGSDPLRPFEALKSGPAPLSKGVAS